MDNIFGHGRYTGGKDDDFFRKNSRFLNKNIFKDGGFNDNLFEESVVLMESETINSLSLEDIYNQDNSINLSMLSKSMLVEDIPMFGKTGGSPAETVAS